MELRHTATREGRLSSFLREEMGMSLGLVNRMKWQGQLFVNGMPQHTNYPVKPGDVITVPLLEPEMDYPAENGALTVIYEDAHLLAVDKPAGMLIHPSHSQNTETLANLVKGYSEKTGQHSAFHPLTRLDRDTFGIVLLAKNAHIHARLQETKVEKTYHAVVFSGPEGEEGIIDAPIARRPLPSLLRFVSPEGKPSRTAYRVLWRKENMTALALQPLTGRTHQLRLHCLHAGFPILGDPQYTTPEAQALSRELGLTYQRLCAAQLVFSHPVTGETLTLRSEMDAQV